MLISEVRHYRSRIPQMTILDNIMTLYTKIKGKEDFWLWNRIAMGAKIMNCMAEENGSDGRSLRLAYWLGLRLKFTDDKTRNILKDFYFHNIKHYTETIDGENRIYDTMKNFGISYPQAILHQYCEKTNFKQSFFIGRFVPIENSSHDMWYTNLSEDGKTVIHYDPKDEPPQEHQLWTEEYKAELNRQIEEIARRELGDNYIE
jgi:hypothetical protein